MRIYLTSTVLTASRGIFIEKHRAQAPQKTSPKRFVLVSFPPGYSVQDPSLFCQALFGIGFPGLCSTIKTTSLHTFFFSAVESYLFVTRTRTTAARSLPEIQTNSTSRRNNSLFLTKLHLLSVFNNCNWPRPIFLQEFRSSKKTLASEHRLLSTLPYEKLRSLFSLRYLQTSKFKKQIRLHKPF